MSTNPDPKSSALRKHGPTVAFMIAVLVLIFGAQAGWFDAPNPLVGQPAPDFSLSKLDGGAVVLADHVGKQPVLLDFFATWCGPCRRSLPDIAQIAKDYAPTGLAVYAVNCAEDPATVKAYLAEAKLEITALLDSNGQVAQSYGVRGIPQQVLIGKDGKVRYVNSGYGFGSDLTLRSQIDKVFAETPGKG